MKMAKSKYLTTSDLFGVYRAGLTAAPGLTPAGYPIESIHLALPSCEKKRENQFATNGKTYITDFLEVNVILSEGGRSKNSTMR